MLAVDIIKLETWDDEMHWIIDRFMQTGAFFSAFWLLYTTTMDLIWNNQDVLKVKTVIFHVRVWSLN